MIDAFTTRQVYVPRSMPDNPPKVEEFRLPGHDVLAVTGRDAVPFAQSQFMNDVAALADGQWQWNGWLTPKGRVIALFALLRLDADTLWLLPPDVDAGDLAAKLQRFVFRSKVKLEARADLHSTGGFGTPSRASGGLLARDGEAVELDLGGDGGPRTLRIAPSKAASDDTLAANWRGFDLRHGLPRLAPAQAEQWTPQQLSLERLKAFSVKKGCYPGQEIVARTHFLGQAKRGLALLQAEAALDAGADVIADGRAIGVLASAQDGLALAVLPLERGEAPLSAAGQPLHPLPLLGGLQR